MLRGSHKQVHQKNLAAALNNCAFVSTEDIDKDLTLPFEFLMDATMLGVGVGFDCNGAGKLTILVGIKVWCDA